MAFGSFLRSFLRKLFSAGNCSHQKMQKKDTGETNRPPHERCQECKKQHAQHVRGRNRAQDDPWPALRPHQQGYGQATHATHKNQPVPGDKWPLRRGPATQFYSYEKPLRVAAPGPQNHHPPLKTSLQDHKAQHLPSTPDEQLYSLRTGSSVAVITDTDRSMNREAVCEVIDMIARRFSHIPYAVSGLAAMVYYGYNAHPFKVSIVCPAHTRENQKGWAIAQGMMPIPRRPDIWGLATTDGLVRQIRVRFPYDFEDIHMLKVGDSAVTILSLAGLADELARTYVNELKYSSLERQEGLAEELVWILKKIIRSRRPEHMLTPERTPHLVKETFWLPFSLSYPDTVPLFEKAGWRIPNEEWH